jgi:hypothetical protein
MPMPMTNILFFLILLLGFQPSAESFSCKNCHIQRTKLYKSTTDSLEICGKCPAAPKCSGEYLTKGCSGDGKIQGGIATIGIFSWWPIKVYRPCPSYLAAGYVYRREGQTMDQVLFSEPSTKMKIRIEELRKQQLKNDDGDFESELLNKKSDQSKEVNEGQLDKAEKLLSERFGNKR